MIGITILVFFGGMALLLGWASFSAWLAVKADGPFALAVIIFLFPALLLGIVLTLLHI